MDTSLRERFLRDGFVAPVPVMDVAAAGYRSGLEGLEAIHGPMHYRFKVHTIMRDAWEMAVAPPLLDAVERILGPDILLYNVTWIIKEPGSAAFVSWHQDLTYWGLSSDQQVSAWLALSPATEPSGCMQMIPGSHAAGQLAHEKTEDAANVLLNGQTVRGVEDSALLVRGTDRFGHFRADVPAEADFDLAALDRQEELNRRLRGITTG